MSTLHNILQLSNYTLNAYSTGPLLVGSLTVIFGLFLKYIEKNSPFNKSLLYFCVASSIWLFSCVLVLNANSGNLAFFWSNALFIGFVLVPVTLLHLSVTLQEKPKNQRYLLFACYIFAGILILLSQTIYPLQGVRRYYYGNYLVVGMLQRANLVFFAVCMGISILNLCIFRFEQKNKEAKNRIALFIFCFVTASLCAIDILASQEYYLFPSGYIAFFGFIVGITCFKIMYYTSRINRHREELKEEVERKTKRLTEVIEELKATQVKLIDTGKRSALASLSAGIMHQISQPITAIHGFVRFIRSEMKETDTFYKPITLIEEQSTHIKKMLEDLNSLVRHREIEKKNISINDPVRKSMDLLTDELRIRRVNWDTFLSDDLPEVYADGVHMQQIFMNIVTACLGSLSELPKGKLRYIKITSSYDSAGDQVLVAFQDTSGGMPKDHTDAVNEPFFTPLSKGAGIDISICRDLIGEHGGSLNVEAEVDQGTKLVVKIPATKETAKSKIDV